MTLGLLGTVTYGNCSTLDDSDYLDSILTKSAKTGKLTGLVTTTRITHATPAAAYAHSVSRWFESSVPDQCETQVDIAQQLVNSGIKFNITFGGGERHFNARNDNQNLIEQWREREDSCYVNTKGNQCIRILLINI